MRETRFRRSRQGVMEMTDTRFDSISGKRTILPIVLDDPIDEKCKLFFVFSDISIRRKGSFSIKADIIDIDQYL